MKSGAALVARARTHDSHIGLFSCVLTLLLRGIAS